jgi:hypothetical protein
MVEIRGYISPSVVAANSHSLPYNTINIPGVIELLGRDLHFKVCVEESGFERVGLVAAQRDHPPKNCWEE